MRSHVFPPQGSEEMSPAFPSLARSGASATSRSAGESRIFKVQPADVKANMSPTCGNRPCDHERYSLGGCPSAPSHPQLDKDESSRQNRPDHDSTWMSRDCEVSRSHHSLTPDGASSGGSVPRWNGELWSHDCEVPKTDPEVRNGTLFLMCSNSRCRGNPAHKIYGRSVAHISSACTHTYDREPNSTIVLKLQHYSMTSIPVTDSVSKNDSHPLSVR